MDGGLPRLSLPDHGVKTKNEPGGARVFDPFRRRWVVLTPEEWVRQHFLNHLVHDLGCPASLIAVERSLVLNELAKRADIVVFSTDGRPLIVVECKAPHVRIDLRTFEQVARYNLVFKVPYVMVTNGYKHFCCRIDHAKNSVDFLVDIPAFADMSPR